MELFVIEIIAIVLLIIVLAFVFNLYKRFYKYFSRSTESNQPDAEPSEETEDKEPEKARFTPPVIVINNPSVPEEPTITTDVSPVDEEEPAVIKAEPQTRLYSPDDSGGIKDISPDMTTRLYLGKDTPVSDSSSVPQEPVTKLYNGADSLSEPPTKKL